MRYCESAGEIEISVREFVALARRGVSQNVPFDEDEPESSDRRSALRMALPNAKKETVETRFSVYPGVVGENGEPPVRFRLSGAPDLIEGNALSLVAAVKTHPSHPPKTVTEQVRGEGFILGYALALREKTDAVTLKFLFVNPDSEETVTTEEHLKFAKLEKFFNQCRRVVSEFAEPEIHRVTKRLPSMRSLAFPYPKVRSGQDEFIRAVFRTVSRGGTLFAEAPTGIGKTVSSLYPAIRAMGEGKCDKIFYFTPKTTTALSVRECLGKLRETGGDIRCVILCGKERICSQRLVCREDKNACERAKNNRIAEAVLYLFRKNLPVIGKEELEEAATEFKVCAHELSLWYAEICDVVVGDLNYLFDPFVYLHRFFDEGGNYAFLIDEAHNLADRAVEMYSDQISESELSPDLLALEEHSKLREVLKKAGAKFHAVLFPYVKEECRKDADGNVFGSTHGKDLPAALYSVFAKLAAETERELFAEMRSKTDADLAPLRNFYRRIIRFNKALENFDDHFEFFLFYEKEDLSLKLFCLDPGRILASRIAKGNSAVFFSGTLTPADYYRTVLGGDRSAEVLEVGSPFVREQLSVSIMDKISTRFSEREKTLPAVLRVIAATVSAKRGNYMIFTPSFTYNAMLADAFRRKYPKIRCIEQTPGTGEKEKAAFLREFEKDDGNYLIAFCVMGGIFSEGIDLAGDRLIGTVIVGTGLPGLSYEREAMSAYYDEKFEAGKQYAYIYPGLNRVFQAAGRVIRTENDRGVIVLIDDRFDDPVYRKAIPELWKGLKFVGDAKGLKMLLDRFWAEADAEK